MATKKNGSKSKSAEAQVPAERPSFEIAPITREYPILNPDVDMNEISEAIRENLADEDVGILDFDRIRVPSGGGLQFEIPTIDGIEHSDHVDGVIALDFVQRALWLDSIEDGGSGNPPDCSSDDGEVGVGGDRYKGSRCADCPYNDFGTAKGGRGKACKEIRQVVLIGDSVIPRIVTVPPTSLAGLKKYKLRLAGAPLKYFAVVTRIKLKSATNKAGVKYSEMTFETLKDDDGKAVRLSSEQIERVKAYRQEFNASIRRRMRAQEMTRDEAEPETAG